MDEYYANVQVKRERSRSPRRRSRSPRRRRSYSPRRSRSGSREEYRRTDRRSRSPMSGAAGTTGGVSGSSYGGVGAAPRRNFEDRSAAKEQMMQSLRDSSQQDRRVYVGNLSYDVKWHHLKDFMRQGRPCILTRPSYLGLTDSRQLGRFSSPTCCYFRMECRRWAPICRCWLVFLVFLWLFNGSCGLTGWDWLSVGLCRDAGI